MGVLILVVTTVAVPFIQDLIEKINNKKTDLKIIDKLYILQGYKENKNGRNKYFRLMIKNKGETTAFDVEPYLEKIEGRKNFIPLPLRWTHLKGEIRRNIHPDQEVYLDLFSFSKKDEAVPHILTSIRKRNSEDLDNLNDGENILEIKMYQKNGKTIDEKIKVYIKEKKSDDGFPEVDM